MIKYSISSTICRLEFTVLESRKVIRPSKYKLGICLIGTTLKVVDSNSAWDTCAFCITKGETTGNVA